MKYEPPSGSAVSVVAGLVRRGSAACAARSAPRARSAAPAPRRSRSCAATARRRTTAESAWIATRTMLFSGCCAVSVEPPVCAWKRSASAFGFVAPKRSRMIARPQPPRRAELRHLLEEVVVRVEEEGEPRAELVRREARRDRRLAVGDAVREREGELLHRGRAGLADVVPGDRDRVPARQPLGAVGEEVGRQPHRRPRREDVVPARDVLLEDVVLDRAAQRVAGRRPAPRRRARTAAAAAPPAR